MPKTYILVGSFYGGKRLADLTEVLEHLPLPDFSLIVDHQCGASRRPQGFAVVYNRLIEHALMDEACEYIWILGDDVGILDPWLFFQFQDEMDKDHSIGAMVPTEAWRRSVLDEGGSACDWELVTVDHRGTEIIPIQKRLTGEREDIVFAGFACCCIRRSVLDNLSIDESLGRGYSEDLDWGIRCWEAGYRCVGSRSHFFIHDRGATYNQLVKDGLYGKDEPYEAAKRAKEKWPFLWEETDEQILGRMRAMRGAVLVCERPSR